MPASRVRGKDEKPDEARALEREAVSPLEAAEAAAAEEPSAQLDAKTSVRASSMGLRLVRSVANPGHLEAGVVGRQGVMQGRPRADAGDA